ncbi:MAG: class I SAM-dependent methyltransferase [Patescibacteria group bacterium]
MTLDSFLNPENVVEEFDVRPGEIIADFGAGSGFFSVALAKRVGHTGKVYALDIRAEALEAVKSKAKFYKILNIEPIRANLELSRGSGLKNDIANKVIISNILFQSENKKNIAEEAYRILKPGGNAIVIEWKEKMEKSAAQNLFETVGFSLKKDFSAGSHHYGLIFKK